MKGSRRVCAHDKQVVFHTSEVRLTVRSIRSAVGIENAARKFYHSHSSCLCHRSSHAFSPIVNKDARTETYVSKKDRNRKGAVADKNKDEGGTSHRRPLSMQTVVNTESVQMG